MALQGTFDTFPLPDVLSLLVSTSKVGRLDVAGEGGFGTLWVDGPSIVGAESGPITDPVEVLVSLLRLADGEFLFEPATPPANGGPVVPIDEALAVAAEYIGEWAGVEAVLPSPDHVVTMRRALAGPEITISAASWSGLVAIGGGGPVRDLLRRFGDADLEAARAIATLVDAGLLDVGQPAGEVASSWLSPGASAPAALESAPQRPVPARAAAPVVDLVAEAAPSDLNEPAAPAGDDEEIGTGQPWRDQVRQLLGTTHAEEPPRIVVERFGPSHTSPTPGDGATDAGASTDAPGDETPSADGDRDVLLKFLGSVQK